ncbi:MAG: septal ring lytic transglycosylase RlpA family protein [Candidatus Aminicenantes bacterium]|nr:septal ring lytic transglycosylase RlpA family protein [Candidatus Aminicenantes bacterium]
MKWTLALCGISVLLFAVSCSARKNSRSEPPQPALETVGSSFSQTGIASWYGDDFHGKRTANGEIYDMHKLTAAHQTLAFHTMVEVENLENGKKVLVRINDRGPFLKNRIIDLSLQAAQRLAMTAQGTAVVHLRVVRWRGAAKTAESTISTNDAVEYCVQAGAFTVRENADDLLLTLAEIFPGLQFKVIMEDGMFKVLSQNFTAADRCRDIITKMDNFHLHGFIRRP